jgi:S-adenosylmethionine:tRNA ribosyltransferase-isomerase
MPETINNAFIPIAKRVNCRGAGNGVSPCFSKSSAQEKNSAAYWIKWNQIFHNLLVFRYPLKVPRTLKYKSNVMRTLHENTSKAQWILFFIKMKTSDFDYHLPRDLIAQFPSEKRDGCRLLCLDRAQHSLSHGQFEDLPEILKAGDRLICNNTKVLPARIFCRKDTGASVELLFTERIDERSWKALARPAKNARKNFSLRIEKEPSIRLHINALHPDNTRTVSIENNGSASSIEDMLERFGEMPLPHYIKRNACDSDKDLYQTIFAQSPGAIASPTAGLHFTEQLVRRLKEKGISFTFLTLHVGMGTFRPVAAEDPRDHHMHEEKFALSPEAVSEMDRTRLSGGRNIAVGTTVVRTLEQCALESRFPVASTGMTRLMILPGFAFKAIDGMITNFHVPRSTLLMLVCAFAGKEFVFEAYQSALQNRYRFFSYGDAMLIL